MARLYVRKRKRKFSQFLMTSVITYIRKTGNSLRETSKMFSVPRTTIQRRIKRDKVFLSRGRKPVLKAAVAREVFQKSREAKSRQEVRKIAYKTAKEQNVKMPRSWIQNESAGVDWCLNFLKKYPYLDFLIKNSKRVVKKEQRFECCVCDEIFYEISEIVLCESCCQVKCVHCYNPSKCLQRKLMDEE